MNQMNCFDNNDVGMIDCHILVENFNDYLSDYLVIVLINGNIQRELVTIDYDLDSFKNVLKLDEALSNSLSVEKLQCIDFKLLKKYQTTDNLDMGTLIDLDDKELSSIHNNY